MRLDFSPVGVRVWVCLWRAAGAEPVSAGVGVIIWDKAG